MIEALGGWTISGIDIGDKHVTVYLSAHLDIDLEDKHENLDKGEGIKVPLLSPNTGKPFANLIILEKADDVDNDNIENDDIDEDDIEYYDTNKKDIYVEFELIDDLEIPLYAGLHVESIYRRGNELSIALFTTLRISDFFIIEEKGDNSIIKLKFPVCILPLYFRDATDILNSIEKSKNPETFHMSVPLSDLHWNYIPDEELDTESEEGDEYEVILEHVDIKLNRGGDVIKTELLLNTGYPPEAGHFNGFINIYYDAEKWSMIAEFLIDKKLLFINLKDETTHVRTDDYNFVTLDFLSKENLLDKLVSNGEFEVPIKDYATAVYYGFYIIDWLRIAGKAILSRYY